MKGCASIPIDITELTDAVEVVAVVEGWSNDRKFRVVSNDGAVWMLRLSDVKYRERKRRQYECLCRIMQADVFAPRPVAFGVCDGGAQVYMLITWVEGRDLYDVLATASAPKQRELGIKAGRLLKQLQVIASLPSSRSWEQAFLRQLEERKLSLEKTGIDLPERDAFLACIERGRHLLKRRSMDFAHGDYHVGNLLVTPDGELAVIDFDRCRIADPWDDHKRVVWDVEASPIFASGRLDGYFEGKIPDEFWDLLAVYCASNAIGSIAWAVPFGEDQIVHHLDQARELFEYYDGMERIIPKWYSPSK